MKREKVIETLEGLIEVAKGCESVTGVNGEDSPWSKDIDALNLAIDAIEENEKLKTKLTKALNSVVEEANSRAKLSAEKQEFIDALCMMINLARNHLVAADSYSAVEKASNLVRKHITEPIKIEA